MEFVLGQRWISQTETELGLGIVVALEGRNVTVRFPVAEEDRVYAQNNTPLARVVFQPGDSLQDQMLEHLTVQAVEDLDGLKCYLIVDSAGEERLLPETQISGLIQLSTPRQRLYGGQFGRAKDFQLRVATLYRRYALQQSQARGLLGVRTNLLPHQIYIAHEVASRFAPRVLLADEVGLGKTIEAGMILHHQLQTGLASRALIVVPDALVHQWLVEMLRKFGLRVALFDRDRFDALLESGETNPFESEQLILCGLSLLVDDEAVVDYAASADWDLMIVDEAHHLTWTEQAPGAAYSAIEALADRCAGLLLLTATPEQLGRDSHFARLRLLDPSRFCDLDQFILEQDQYVLLNDIVHTLTQGEALSGNQQALLNQFGGLDFDSELPAQKLIDQLLDRHGTGRVLFRNTRAAIAGFPQRELYSYALTPDMAEADMSSMLGLQPEMHLRHSSQDWLREDPRVAWLEQFFKDNRQEKILLICASAQTAIDLEKYLHLNVGVRSAAFYEGLSIVERDRAAAYFADSQAGAQTLICSEIGSEGRNFQFAHHLILFDLPVHPDLLEQRIGRLDRIGQRHNIQIHVPYIAGGAQEILYRWYSQGMQAFTQSFSAGATVKARFDERLQPLLKATESFDSTVVDALVAETRAYTEQVRAELALGRDQLLELNSCRPAQAQQVIQAISNEEAGSDIQDFVTLACDVFGLEPEHHSEKAFILKPTEHMLNHEFPLVPDEGLMVTFDREKALVREDMEFVTWESPMISGVMEMVLGSELGNTNISTIELKVLPAGTLLVECFYAIACSAPKKYQVSRFLPFKPVRVLLDSSGRDLTDLISHDQLNKLCKKVRKSARPAIIKEIRHTLDHVLDRVEDKAQLQVEGLLNNAKDSVADILGAEISRLRQLKQVNPSIREEETMFFEDQQQQVMKFIGQASLEPQAVRVVIAT